MAETYKNAKLLVPITTAEAAYTCPAATTAIVKHIVLSNVDSASRWVTVQWTDDSDSDAVTRLAYQVAIPVGASLEISGPLTLETGDQLQAVCSVDHKIEMSVSLLEIT